MQCWSLATFRRVIRRQKARATPASLMRTLGIPPADTKQFASFYVVHSPVGLHPHNPQPCWTRSRTSLPRSALPHRCRRSPSRRSSVAPHRHSRRKGSRPRTSRLRLSDRAGHTSESGALKTPNANGIVLLVVFLNIYVTPSKQLRFQRLCSTSKPTAYTEYIFPIYAPVCWCSHCIRWTH
jgi:hypothetical protein